MLIYGYHSCYFALLNKRRKIFKIYFCDPIPRLPHIDEYKSIKLTKKELDHLVPNAVHQNIVMDVAPLDSYSIEFLLTLKSNLGCVLVLDQVSDPHNIGAIFRSACVFKVDAILMTKRHIPGETGVLVKSASGAFDKVPFIYVNNLNQALESLKTFGFWLVGLSELGHQALSSVDFKHKIALILGSEGDGLRSLTKKQCDFLASIPGSSDFSTLNVSNAAAISLYEMMRQRTT